MKNLGIEVSEDGRCEWRNNGGVIERRFERGEKGAWESVSRPCPITPTELENFCEAGGFGYIPPKTII